MKPLAKLLWAFTLAIALVSVVEAGRVPTRLYGAQPWLSLEVVGAALRYALAALSPALLPAALGTLLARSRPRLAFGLVAVTTLALASAAHLVVTFAEVLPVPWYAGLAYGLFALATAAAVVPEVNVRALESPRTRPALLAGFGALAVVGHAVNGTFFASGYPGLHYAILLFVTLAATVVVSPIAERLAPRRGVAVALGLLLVTPVALSLANDRGAGHLRRYTYLGMAPLVVAPLTMSPGPGGAPASPAPLASRRSAALPDALDIGELNVLLVTWEATSLRHTSLGGAPPEVTPHLRALAARSRSYSRAYAASSNTFQSMSAVLAMGLPSTVPLATSHRRWRGRLGEEVTTAAEYFGRLGARTIWVAHDYRRMFSREDGIVGLGRGFEDVQLVIGSWDPEVDRRVAQRAVKHIGRAAPRRFFAWVHLTSPHFPYVPHGGAANGDARAAHLGEVRFADEQLGYLLEGLETQGLADHTIVIVTADHGEEFGEHGSDAHGYTLYEEVVHVPLVVHLPGEAPRVFDHPTSNTSVLPALLTHRSSAVRAEVEAQLAAHTAPLLEASAGAVVSELLGTDRTQVALIWPDHKLLYDAHSRLAERFDLRADPEEQRPRAPEPWRLVVLDEFLSAQARYRRATLR